MNGRSNEPAEEGCLFKSRRSAEYADFVHVRPFYESLYGTLFQKLWSENKSGGDAPGPQAGAHQIIYSLEYSAEAFFYVLIEKATHAKYESNGGTHLRVDENASRTISRESEDPKREGVGSGPVIVIIPR